tara:strand:+ start:636 stop:1001 length:366 start_codon:yes stop_codon:yes gene_type:complete
MDNTKRETFRRLLDSRLPKTHKSIKLLGNLSRKGQYEYTHLEAQELIKGLKNEVNQLAVKFKVTTTPEPIATNIADTTIEGELDRNDRSNLAWAYDMLLRGRNKDAHTLIKRILKQQQGDK